MEDNKPKEIMKIKNFSEVIAEKLENEGIVKPTQVEVAKPNNPLPNAKVVKDISTFLDDVDNKTTNMGKKELENEGIVKPKEVEKTSSKGLPTVGKIKNISTFIDDIDTKVIDILKDKGVTMSTYSIAGCCGVTVDELSNVLDKLSDGGKIVKKSWGKDSFWFIQK